MHLAGFLFRHKAIHLKCIPIPTFDLISIHLIQVCIRQAMNTKKHVLTVLQSL